MAVGHEGIAGKVFEDAGRSEGDKQDLRFIKKDLELASLCLDLLKKGLPICRSKASVMLKADELLLRFVRDNGCVQEDALQGQAQADGVEDDAVGVLPYAEAKLAGFAGHVGGETRTQEGQGIALLQPKI